MTQKHARPVVIIFLFYRYPLVVKLGTITPTSADIFSYAKDENDMVLDPLLSQHLQHWGIDIMQQEKTEKTMVSLKSIFK